MATDTIYAVSTPPGVSGVAVVRISGPDSGEVLSKLAGPLPKARQASLKQIRNPATADLIDEALVLWFPGPASFTGENMAEIQCHGSFAVLSALKLVLSGLDCRPADPGEFSRRAFDNQKMDLLDAEALDQVIQARDPAMLKIAQGQMGHERQEVFERWKTDLTQLQAACEALIDFPEDDLPDELVQQNQQKLDYLFKSVAALERRSALAQAISSGLEVLIVGPPNVGKSTLLNAIAGYERAIVTSIPGTTRDFVELDIQLGDFQVRFVDTAGLRETEDQVEKLGIERTQARLDQAALILSLHEKGCSPQNLETSASIWPVQSKGFDLAKRSVAAGEDGQRGLENLLEEIEQHFTHIYGEAMTDLSFQRDRQVFHVKQLADSLNLAKSQELLPEMQAEHLRQAAHALAHLSGTIHVEDVLDSLFSGFCIGK